ncbi:MAG TPA: RNA polymerase subunit sigma [Savagea sp.]
MSLKAIELQIALPKTFEAGKVAEQKQQQVQVNQDVASELAKREERMKKTVVQKGEPSKALKNEREDQANEHVSDRARKKEEDEETVERQKSHPYKGSFVDFSS